MKWGLPTQEEAPPGKGGDEALPRFEQLVASEVSISGQDHDPARLRI